FIIVFKVRRATSNRLRSMSATALSNRTLSGCRVSFVIGFSYFFFRKQEVFSRLKTAASRMKLRRIDLERTICHLKEKFKLERVPPPGRCSADVRAPPQGPGCEKRTSL